MTAEGNDNQKWFVAGGYEVVSVGVRTLVEKEREREEQLKRFPWGCRVRVRGECRWNQAKGRVGDLAWKTGTQKAIVEFDELVGGQARAEFDPADLEVISLAVVTLDEMC